MEKVKIELTPYAAMSLLSFLSEFESDMVGLGEQGKALWDAYKEYESEVVKNITNEQLEEGEAENKVNQLIGKSPKR